MNVRKGPEGFVEIDLYISSAGCVEATCRFNSHVRNAQALEAWARNLWENGINHDSVHAVRDFEW